MLGPFPRGCGMNLCSSLRSRLLIVFIVSVDSLQHLPSSGVPAASYKAVSFDGF